MSAAEGSARRWIVVVIASLILGMVFSEANVPAAWILAAIIAAAASALISGKELHAHPVVNRLGRGTIGVLAGLPLLGVPADHLARFLPAAIVATALTLTIGVIGGYMLSRHEPSIHPETGILSMLAGGSSMMPALAAEIGADYRYVTLSQYLRLLVVSVSLPLVALAFGHSAPSPVKSGPWFVTHVQHFWGSLLPHEGQPWWLLLLLLVVILGGEKLGRLIHMPAPMVLAPMVLAITVAFALPPELSFTPPYWLKIISYLSIGWACGGGLSLPALKFFARQLPATLLFIAALLVGCAGTAWLLTLWWQIPYFEAYLATSPGALETVLALSNEGGAGPEVVGTQVVRLIAVVVLAGLLPQVVRVILRVFPLPEER